MPGPVIPGGAPPGIGGAIGGAPPGAGGAIGGPLIGGGGPEGGWARGCVAMTRVRTPMIARLDKMIIVRRLLFIAVFPRYR